MPFPWLKIENKSESVGEIHIYGQISDEKWFEEDVTPTSIKKEIDGLGDRNVNVYVNSPGGGVYAGMTIMNLLGRLKGYKTGFVDGIAASAATYALMAMDKVIMPKSSMIMIHNPSSIAIGSANELRKEADILDRIQNSIGEVYAKKTGIPKNDIFDLMDKETWMGGEEAVKLGFADVVEQEKVLNMALSGDSFAANGIEFSIKDFRAFPKNRFNQHPKSESPQAERLINARQKFLQLKKEVLA